MLKKNKEKIIVAVLLIFAVVLAVILVKNYNTKKEEVENKNMTGIYYVEMKITDYGIVKMELDGTVAPITVENFVDLVDSKFYDGLTFHRIIHDFMMQGGDPSGDGSGGSDKTIKGEFEKNNIKNPISHVRGTVSMARNPLLVDSATSQFFIVQKDSEYLDGEYAAFGKVISGMDVVDKVIKDSKPIDDNGTIPKSKQPIIEYIKVVNK